jgi:hypothetical protein
MSVYDMRVTFKAREKERMMSIFVKIGKFIGYTTKKGFKVKRRK